MTPRANELAVTILRIVSEGNLGTDATGHFAKLDDIIEEIENKNDTKNVINNFLLPLKYIRKVNDKFKTAHNHALEYTAYQITQLGKTYLNSQGSLVAQPTNYSSASPNNIDQAIERLGQLIVQADAVLATHMSNPPGMIGFSTLNTEKFQQWKASSENIIKTICGAESNYYENFKEETKSGSHIGSVNAGKGILLALKDDVNAGLYSSTSQVATTSDVSKATVTSDTVSLKISNEIYSHIKIYLETKDYFHAVEESYKVVREKLREITGKEKATDIFNMNAESNKYHEQIFGKIAESDSPESDFFRGIGYLNLTIQFLRNEKTHTLATNIDENLAIHYISLASLAYDLISRGSKE